MTLALLLDLINIMEILLAIGLLGILICWVRSDGWPGDFFNSLDSK